MTLNTVICDDSKSDISSLEYFLQKYSIQQVDTDFSTETFMSAEEFLSRLDKPHNYNIIFLDIEMTGMDGITLAEEIRKKENDEILLIFVSSYPQYMQNSFQVQPFRFLTKPVSYSEFEPVMNAAIRSIIKSAKNLSILPLADTETGKLIIRLDDIVYIETITEKRRCIRITLSDGKKYEVRGIISDWEKDLSSEQFLSPSRSTLVNIIHIRYIEREKIFMTSGDEIVISRRRQREIHEFFSRNVLRI